MQISMALAGEIRIYEAYYVYYVVSDLFTSFV